MNLTINAEQIGGINILRLSGGLELPNVYIVREKIRDLLDDNQQKIIIDLQELDFIDLSGIGVLVGLLARYKQQFSDGPDWFVIIINIEIEEVFITTLLDQLFMIFKTQEDAIAHLNCSTPNQLQTQTRILFQF